MPTTLEQYNPPAPEDQTMPAQTFDTLDVSRMQTQYHVEFPGTRSSLLEADFGILSTTRGNLNIVTYTQGDAYTGTLNEYNKAGKAARGPRDLIEISKLFDVDDKSVMHSNSVFLRSVGFSKKYRTTPEGKKETVLTAPSNEYVNSVLIEVYRPTGEQPPVEFITMKDPQHLTITGKEYIEALAEGKMVMTEPGDGNYDHDMSAHLKALFSLDPTTFGLIVDRAKELVTAGKLTTDEQGFLTDRDAKRLVIAVDGLTAEINSEIPGTIKMSSLRGWVETILGKKLPGLQGGLELGRMRKRLKTHREWVNSRLAEINETSSSLSNAA